MGTEGPQELDTLCQVCSGFSFLRTKSRGLTLPFKALVGPSFWPHLTASRVPVAKPASFYALKPQTPCGLRGRHRFVSPGRCLYGQT